VAIALLTTSCGTSSGSATGSSAPRRSSQRVLYKWYDDGGEGRVTIRISLSDQIAEFKRGGRDIGWCYVATGKEGHSTAAGSYTITEKIEDKYSNLYGWFEDEFGNVTDNDARSRDRVPPGMVYVPAPMPHWMRLTSYGVGMHGGVIPEPGQPASHGCIRLPKDFVPVLYDSVSVGTPVTITYAPSNRVMPEPDIESQAPQPQLTRSRGNNGPVRSPNGSVQSVTYRNGMPVSFD
jgi:lipoprotein-anchoring transpeptidase ErfK/SrfK